MPNVHGSLPYARPMSMTMTMVSNFILWLLAGCCSTSIVSGLCMCPIPRVPIHYTTLMVNLGKEVVHILSSRIIAIKINDNSHITLTNNIATRTFLYLVPSYMDPKDICNVTRPISHTRAMVRGGIDPSNTSIYT